jgi:ATP-binding cassette subfamily B protein
MGLIAGIGTLIVIWAGGRAVVDGRLTLGALVAFNGYLAYLTWPTLALGWTLSTVRRGLTSMGRILEIVDESRTTGSTRAGRDERLRDVEHAARHQVLASHVRLRRPAAGASRRELRGGARRDRGGGRRDRKRQVDPWTRAGPTLGAATGTVFLGGRDVTELSLDALRAQIAYVPQEGFLFSRSIAENITLGRDGVERDQLQAAAAVAGVADEIERFSAGFEAVVGERGLTLSGGQRQRVTLARALAGGPSVIVLDDAFASVDAVKEEEILASLRRALRRTDGLTDDPPAARGLHR